MAKTLKIGAALSVALLSFSAQAAKPTSIKYVEDVVNGDVIYSHYVVNCSNSTTHDISAWDNRKKWCIGF